MCRRAAPGSSGMEEKLRASCNDGGTPDHEEAVLTVHRAGF